VAVPSYGPAGTPIEVVPVVVVSRVFPARPSSIPDIRDFVRRCLAESPLTEDGTREVGETVFRALLDAAGPTGSIQVAFRIFPEHVEVDVLHSDTAIQSAVAPGPPVSYPDPAIAGEHAGASQPASGGPPATSAFPPVPPLYPVTPLYAVSSGPDAAAAQLPSRPGNVAAGATGGNAADGSAQPESFAEWMSSALRREGLTQEAAARQLGVSVKTVSRWVGGATEPRMRDLRRIQEVFGELPLP
jgi:DNA-binding XRE family transcriptional regulator